MKKTLFFSRKSYNIFFHILTQCNLACRHCYINQDQHGSSNLDIETIYLWLKLFANKLNNYNIIFLGGEPTIHPHLDLAIKKARSLGYRSITVDTNGYLIFDILKKIEPRDVDLFSFSLDGPTPNSNDALRGKGSYKCCIEAIIGAKKKGFKTSVIFTLSMANFHYLNKMPELLSLLCVDHFFIQVIGLRGKWLTNQEVRKNLRQVNKTSWLEAIPKIARQVANEGIAVTYPKVFLKPEDIFECSGLVSNNYFIFPNGRVYRCPLCEDYPIHSKEIKNGVLVDTQGVNETSLFALNIPEGCVMNKVIQPGNIEYNENSVPKHKVACCMLKEELLP